MRASTLSMGALLLLTPLVTGAVAPPPASLPDDLSDADLLRLLAAHHRIPLRDVPLHVPADATLEGVTLRLAARAGVDLTPAQHEELQRLDPRIAAPTRLALLAIEQAWGLRDEAFAAVPPADHARLRTLDPASPEAARLAANVDTRPLYEAAILLLDTLESHALPALRDAARAAPWPPTPLVDNPVLRLGGTGNDAIASDRILQIDPAGDDTHRNNAGASTLLDPGTLLQTPIAVSIDFAGNDRYDRLRDFTGSRPPAQGSGLFGVGVLLDFGGDDAYIADAISQGAAGYGVGLLRDVGGNDMFTSLERSTGWSAAGPGVLRDDAGNDRRSVGYDSGAAAISAPDTIGDTFALLWDRGGDDAYSTHTPIVEAYGWVSLSGTAWLVEEGAGVDMYSTASFPGVGAHGCNDCEWRGGAPHPADGRGFDNGRSLLRLLMESPPYGANVTGII